jgi:serine/threonine-protein kinase
MDQGPTTGSVAAQAPTTGAQVFPAPPPSTAKKGSGPLIAGAAVVGVLVLVGVVLLIKGGSSSGDGDTTITVPSGSAPVTTLPPDPVESGQPVASSVPSTGTGTPPQKSTGGTGTTTKPPVDNKAEEECRAAMNLAAGGNTSLAVKRFASCDGPSKSAARSAIDGSARRAVASKGCAAKSDAIAAASIGANGAMADLRKRGCK